MKKKKKELKEGVKTGGKVEWWWGYLVKWKSITSAAAVSHLNWFRHGPGVSAAAEAAVHRIAESLTRLGRYPSYAAAAGFCLIPYIPVAWLAAAADHSYQHNYKPRKPTVSLAQHHCTHRTSTTLPSFVISWPGTYLGNRIHTRAAMFCILIPLNLAAWPFLPFVLTPRIIRALIFIP